MSNGVVYENKFYVVLPNTESSGYILKNKATQVIEGLYEKLPSAITGADTTNDVLIRIVDEKMNVKTDSTD